MFSWAETISELLKGTDLSEQQAGEAMREIMSGQATSAQIAGFLVALRAKGETVAEITGLARTMRELSEKVSIDGVVVDTCGTGGDRSGTANISTMAALVVAGAGVMVAKHGNRAASSQCGSADLFEALGVAIDLGPQDVGTCIREAGIGFCFAPAFHPATRHAVPVRRELGVATAFNFLGPLTSPAGVSLQTVGVSDERMAPIMAEALHKLGTVRSFVFRGDDGLDELTTTTTSTLWSIDREGVHKTSFDPESQLKIPRASHAELVGGDSATNAKIAVSVLEGNRGAVSDAVALNAAAALVVAGGASDFPAGLEAARESIASGKALRALERMRDVSQRLAASAPIIAS